VKASLTGSIIGNLLVVLGFAMLCGGLRHKELRFARVAPRAAAAPLIRPRMAA